MKRLIVRILSIYAFSLVCSPAYAIVTRHDVADSKYLELAANVPAPTILLTDDLGSVDGMGVWIAPDWFLTAANVGEMIEVGDNVGAKQEHQVAAVIVHPDSPDTPLDVALVRVSRMANDVNPVEICAVTNLEGKTAIFVGAGHSGNGKTGPTQVDGKMRAARNIISSASEQFVSFVFDAPDSTGAVELEGISGPGDSGGPAYLRTETGFCVLAVSSGRDTDPTSGLEGRYGVVEQYSRVDVMRDWIMEVTARSVDPQAQASMTPLEAHMYHWISGSGQWRSPNSAFDVDAEPMTLPWIKEFGVNWTWSDDRTHLIGEILAYPVEAEPIVSSTMYAFYNAVTNEVLQVHVARNGNLIVSSDESRRTPTPYGEAEVSDATDYAADGSTSVTRHSNVFVDEITQRSDVLAKQDDGTFKLIRQWQWTKIPE